MAQYLAITGSSFGHGHDDDPIYTITADSGLVYRSGSGGYIHNPATASKVELTDGIKIQVDDAATTVTATVSSSFNCAAETAVGIIGEAGTCRNIWVSETYDSSTQYGVQYLKPNEVDPTRTLYSALLGTPYNYGGTDGTVFNVCSTSTPSTWDFNANGGSGGIVDLGDDVVNLADGGDCTQDSDCSFTPPTPTPTGTPTMTPSAQLRTILLTDSEPDSTINGSAAGLSIGSTQRNYTQDDVDAGPNQGLVGPILISYNAGEEFTISTVDLDDGAGGSYTYTLSDYVAGAGYYLSITGSFPDTDGGVTTTVDVTITGTAEANYDEEIHYTNSVTNGTLVISSVTPSTSTFSQTANTASFNGNDGDYYTASFAFTAITDYEWGAGDITAALTAGSPDANLDLINTTTVGATRTYFYGSEIGANDAFAELDFSGSPRWALDITNASRVAVDWRIYGNSTWNVYKAYDTAPPEDISIGFDTTQIELRIKDHDGKYQITESETEIISISNQTHNQEQDGVHLVTLTQNTDTPATVRNLTVQVGQQPGADNPAGPQSTLSIAIAQDSNA